MRGLKSRVDKLHGELVKDVTYEIKVTQENKTIAHKKPDKGNKVLRIVLSL